MEIKEPGSYNIISYLAKYGPLLNRVAAFIYQHACGYIYPQCCNVTRGSNYTRVESKCETTALTIMLVLTGKEWNNMGLIGNLILGDIMEELHQWNLIEISIHSRGEFGGHHLIIVRDND
jgi:hypothetical protein